MINRDKLKYVSIRAIAAFLGVVFILAFIQVGLEKSGNTISKDVIGTINGISFFFWIYFFNKKYDKVKLTGKKNELQKLKNALDRDKGNRSNEIRNQESFETIEINKISNGDTIVFDYIDSKGIKTKGRVIKISKIDQIFIQGICLETNQFKRFKKENIVNSYSINTNTGEVKQLQTSSEKLVTTPKQRTAFYTKLKRDDLIMTYKKLKISPILYLYVTDKFMNQSVDKQSKIIMSCIGIEEWVEAVYLKYLKDDIMEDLDFYIYDGNKIIKATEEEKEKHIDIIYTRIEENKY